MVFEKHVKSNFNLIGVNILTRLLMFSAWKYLLACALFASVHPEWFGGWTKTCFSLFFILFSIVSLSILLISLIKYQKSKLDAIVEFSDKLLIVKHQNDNSIDEKKWSWIKDAFETEDAFIFRTNDSFSIPFIIQKSELTDDQITFFQARGPKPLKKGK